MTIGESPKGGDLTDVGVLRGVQDELAEMTKQNGRAIWEGTLALMECQRRVRATLRRDAEVLRSLPPECIAAHCPRLRDRRDHNRERHGRPARNGRCGRLQVLAVRTTVADARRDRSLVAACISGIALAPSAVDW